jgi:RNA polymerase sigma factor for flagellar operon FliA
VGDRASAGVLQDRAELAQRYVPLVRHNVAAIAARVPRHVCWDDLVSAGMLGLAEAARSFDPQRGVPFDAYASNRIRGALLDELRSMDWATRSVRTKARLVEERANILTARLRRTATRQEIAADLGLEVTEVERIADDVRRAVVVQYDALGDEDGSAFLTAPGARPEEVVLEHERLAYLRAAVAALPERMRTVVNGYFFDERLMKDIGVELGITESRVSQLRAEALVLLRDGMNQQLDPHLLPEVADPGSRPARRRAAYLASVPRQLDPAAA